MTSLADAYDEPLNVMSVAGAVILVGPGPVALALTPEAAVASAERLLQAARDTTSEDASPQENLP